MSEDDLDRRECLKRLYPDAGPAWLAAIEFGVDVAMLEENLAMSIEARFIQMQSMVRFAEGMEAARGAGDGPGQ